MKTNLSVVMITKNSADVVGVALESVAGMWGELLVDDEGSTDGTREILRRYGATIVASGKQGFGKRKQNLVAQAKGDWILVLDADERVSEELRGEIVRLKDSKTVRQRAFRISYQNYVFGKPVYYGGEKYSKVRLFRNGFGRVSEVPLHEEIDVDGKVGQLKEKIHHHSYRTPWQLFSKFTQYAKIAAGGKQDGFRVGPGMTNDAMVKKLFFYGPHMFWARFIKEKGYLDGWRGFILAFAFAYMETLTYWFLLV
ncbi:glycosyltransferase family 2 protein [Candidatus Gottesmanbacteria bacterium]|nr:glycosyltransferase family 2 protein [Candidatus Gottesmanbacteria bacterium]